MKTVSIYGSSDDLIEIEGIKGANEFGLSGETCEEIDISRPFVIGGKMKIYAIYDGCWHFSIGPVDEGIQIPNWPVRFSLYESGYSALMQIDVPDEDAVLFQLK